jgi:hypothetical protein
LAEITPGTHSNINFTQHAIMKVAFRVCDTGLLGATDNMKDKYLGVNSDLKQKVISNKIKSY